MKNKKTFGKNTRSSSSGGSKLPENRQNSRQEGRPARRAEPRGDFRSDSRGEARSQPRGDWRPDARENTRENNTRDNNTRDNNTRDRGSAGGKGASRRGGKGDDRSSSYSERREGSGGRDTHDRKGGVATTSSRRPQTRQGAGNGPRPDNFRNYNERKEGTPRVRIALYGTHAVAAALLNPERTIHHIYATEQTEDEVIDLVAAAQDSGRVLPPVTLLEKEAFDRALPKGTVHQGIGISCDPLPDFYMTDLINRVAARDTALVLVLDQVTDPHNLGAILRSACAFGADAIIVQSRHAPELNGVVAKIASGALEHLPVLYETNLARSIETLQGKGFFALALDERGAQTIGEVPSYDKVLLVLGAEGPGLRPLVREKCDILAQLPTFGALSSLNVSNAAAVALYAVVSKR